MRILKKTTIIFFLFISILVGNNIILTNVFILSKDTNKNTAIIKFDLYWENSWRDSVNYDAAWVFAKIKNSSDKWMHVKLDINASNHKLDNPDAVIEIGETDGEGVGAFIYRGVEGYGTFSTKCELLFHYTDEWFDTNFITVDVFAIEMVFIPEGPFYVGSGGTEINHFYKYGGNDPYYITSENEIIVGTNSDNLYYSSEAPYYAGGDQLGPIPSSFPKGYKSFYCMKYEITQEQYVEFLNSIDSLQASNRYSSDSEWYGRKHRYNIVNIDGVFSTNKPFIACAYLNAKDGLAYADWAGLRPMTELEFEKICRLDKYPLPNEYAWNSDSIMQAKGIAYPYEPNEMALNTGANCVFGDHDSVQGPLRVGCFATSSSSQEDAGAAYSGVMEMSGNLLEFCITVGDIDGRAFSGQTGDGEIDSLGHSNVANWPTQIAEIGFSLRGSSWFNLQEYCRISDRFGGAVTYWEVNSRVEMCGFRCVR
ncbi:MAG: SUMF1/EgtB/PvdO family nonheme iron enzyme [Ignavibacteriales bacterium]|nr:SUMF1/EgtB/PvdO family nonheme iron enzyme [Ignavibacteriales bacterium]